MKNESGYRESLWEELLFIFRAPKIIFLLLILMGLSIFGMWLKTTYVDPALFDTSRKVSIKPEEVNWIEVRAGNWRWPDAASKFSQKLQFEIDDRNEINTFCKLISKSSAKYLENQRHDFGLDIRIIRNNSRPVNIEVGRNYQKQFFLVHQSHTYEGNWLPELMRQWFEKYRPSSLGPPDPRYPY